ncbi:MAG TPA: SDR family NAD(P)-dependent oxidoreductase [Alphaproteobacteria bacterium]
MNLDGKTILVTGSTDGVGRRVAERLGAAGATVLIHGRDRARGTALADQIDRSGRGRAKFHQADFASLGAVRGLAEAVMRDETRLDVLINNAGLGSGPPGHARAVSADGHELRFAVNYLAGVLLTHLLLPLLKASAPARIVNVASLGQTPIDFDDVMLTREYDGRRAYTQSKLAQIMFTFDLARQLDGSGVTVTCLHPATFMDTTMVRQSGVTPISTVDQGAEAILNLAVAPEMEGKTGLYYDGLKPAQADPQAYDETARAKLHALAARLTGIA